MIHLLYQYRYFQSCPYNLVPMPHFIDVFMLLISEFIIAFFNYVPSYEGISLNLAGMPHSIVCPFEIDGNR